MRKVVVLSLDGERHEIACQYIEVSDLGDLLVWSGPALAAVFAAGAWECARVENE